MYAAVAAPLSKPTAAAFMACYIKASPSLTVYEYCL